MGGALGPASPRAVLIDALLYPALLLNLWAAVVPLSERPVRRALDPIFL